MFEDSNFWVLLAVLIFIGLVYKKASAVITGALDKRADTVRQQLAEAQALREEAQSMLDDYQRQQQAAEQTAKDIVAKAEEDAKRLYEQTLADAETAIERQKAQAELRIAQMEASAVSEIRAIAAEVAVNAARQIIVKSIEDGKGDVLLQQSIDDLPSRLN